MKEIETGIIIEFSPNVIPHDLKYFYPAVVWTGTNELTDEIQTKREELQKAGFVSHLYRAKIRQYYSHLLETNTVEVVEKMESLG